MSSIDAVILTLTERFCHAFQRLTGRTNVWLAFQLTNLSIVMYFVWAAVYIWGTRGVTRTLIAVFSGVLLWGVSQTLLRVQVDASEQSAYRRVAKGIRNPRQLRDALLRIPFLTMSTLLLFPVMFVYANLRLVVFPLVYLLVVVTTAILYLLACDPLPPCRGLVREWFRFARPASADSLAPTRE